MKKTDMSIAPLSHLNLNMPAALLKIRGQDIWQVFVGGNYMNYVNDRKGRLGMDIYIAMEVESTPVGAEERVNSYMANLGVSPEAVWFTGTTTEAVGAFRAVFLDDSPLHVTIPVPLS